MIEVGYERRDRIAYITLNRPEAKNALTPEMHDEMCGCWSSRFDFARRRLTQRRMVATIPAR
jgi:1,4-dihydroxy-2-naphthoyl-CoA synthase